MICFTSDLHLGHKNIIKLCSRPFTSLKEMDETLITNWNQVVTNGDTVYVIGDLMFRTQNHPRDVLKRLKGKKHLILGNHDKSWLKCIEATDFFQSVESYVEISDGKRKLALCHYPKMPWGGTGKGSYLIHGHIHNNVMQLIGRCWLQWIMCSMQALKSIIINRLPLTGLSRIMMRSRIQLSRIP